MPRPKFVELIISSGDAPAHPLAGYVIVSDYRDEKGRHLFLKRNETTEAPKTRKKKTPSPTAKTQTGFTEQDIA